MYREISRTDHVYNSVGSINEIPQISIGSVQNANAVLATGPFMYPNFSKFRICKQSEIKQKYQGNNFFLCYFDVDKIWLLAASTCKAAA